MNKKVNIFLLFIFLVFSMSLFAVNKNIGKIDYIYLFKTSFVMIALLIQSLLSLTFSIERYLYFKGISFDSKSMIKNLKLKISSNNFESILIDSSTVINPFNVILKSMIENRGKSKEELEEIYEIIRLEEKIKMEKYMVILGTSTAIAPLLGLLGTVTGIMSAFSSLAVSGSGGPSVIAAGVSEALVTTAFGLLIGIPILFVFNMFNSKIKSILSEMDIYARNVLILLEKK